MANVYMSVLGTTDYAPCNYAYEGRDPIPDVRFVQEAGVSLHCRDWGESDRIVIFLTRTSEEKNWEDNGHKDESGASKRVEGLRTRLEKLGVAPRLCPTPIPEGRKEDEIWEIFQIILNTLDQGDEVIFDVTHGFRSIPMLAFAALNYAKALKGVVIRGILYGAFEASPNPNARPQDVPIFDLTKYDNLLDWGQAVDRFLEAGDASEVGRLAREGLKPFLTNKAIRQDQTARDVNKLAGALAAFTKDIATCRGPNLSRNPRQVKDLLRVCEGQEFLKALTPLMERVKEKLEPFDGDVVRDGLRTARWCLEHNLIQQGYTVLQEIIITHVCIKLGVNYLPRCNREAAARLIHGTAKLKMGKGCAAHRGPGDDGEEACAESASPNRAAPMNELIDALKGTFSELSDLRNNINHAAFREPDPKSKREKVKTAESLTDRLRKLIADVEKLLLPQGAAPATGGGGEGSAALFRLRCGRPRLFPAIAPQRSRLRIPFC